MKQFNPGDIVTLRSGGPNMTVEKYDERVSQLANMIGGPPSREGSTQVICIWFEGSQKKTSSFEQDTLKRVED